MRASALATFTDFRRTAEVQATWKNRGEAEQSLRQMTLEHQRSPSVPLACSLWLAGHRQSSSLGVLSHIPAEAKGLATTEPYCQNIVLSTYLGISGPVALGFPLCLLPLHYTVFFLILSSLNPISVCYYSIIPLSLLLLLLVSHYSCFASIPIFALSKLFLHLSSFAFAPDPVSHHSPFHS